MVRVGRQEAPITPDWFLLDMKVVSSNFRLIWAWKSQKWLVVSPAPVNIFRAGFVVEHVVEKNKAYAPLDRRAMKALQRARFERDHEYSLDKHLQQIDEEEAAMVWNAYLNYAYREVAFVKKVNQLLTTTTFA